MISRKKELYDDIRRILKDLGVDEHWYPIKAADIAALMPDIELEYIPYSSPHIGAIMLRDKVTGISVNSNRPAYDQNFDIAHELVHYWLHPETTSFSFDAPVTSRDRRKEWQANEGAAQILVPYEDFIPRFIRKAAEVEENYESVETIYYDLARHYGVNPVVIDYRIRNLDDEISQYHGGTKIRDIVLAGNFYTFNRHKKVSVHKALLDKLKERNG